MTRKTNKVKAIIRKGDGARDYGHVVRVSNKRKYDDYKIVKIGWNLILLQYVDYSDCSNDPPSFINEITYMKLF